jgi:type I restriction enzyme M protein
MAHVYETMLPEMRDAAGDSGEITHLGRSSFICPAVVPKIGEIVLAPAAGHSAVLRQALEHQTPRVKTAQQDGTLHANLRGIEKSPFPSCWG